MRINLIITINSPHWWNRLFICRHEVVLVEENFLSRYGTHTSYKYCLKCRRQAMEIENNCKHELNTFGNCLFCLSRQAKFDCEHEWVEEPDTNDSYCDKCGEWKDKEEAYKEI